MVICAVLNVAICAVKTCVFLSSHSPRNQSKLTRMPWPNSLHCWTRWSTNCTSGAIRYWWPKWNWPTCETNVCFNSTTIMMYNMIILKGEYCMLNCNPGSITELKKVNMVVCEQVSFAILTQLTHPTRRHYSLHCLKTCFSCILFGPFS